MEASDSDFPRRLCHMVDCYVWLEEEAALHAHDTCTTTCEHARVTPDETRGRAQRGTRVRAQRGTRVRAQHGTRVRAESVTMVRAQCVTRLRAESVTRVRAESVTTVRDESVTRVRAETVTTVRAESVTRVRAQHGTTTRAQSGIGNLGSFSDRGPVMGQKVTTSQLMVTDGSHPPLAPPPHTQFCRHVRPFLIQTHTNTSPHRHRPDLWAHWWKQTWGPVPGPHFRSPGKPLAPLSPFM